MTWSEERKASPEFPLLVLEVGLGLLSALDAAPTDSP